jgi:hypothetical protein
MKFQDRQITDTHKLTTWIWLTLFCDAMLFLSSAIQSEFLAGFMAFGTLFSLGIAINIRLTGKKVRKS